MAFNNNMHFDQKFVMLASLNISLAGITAFIQKAITPVLPILSALAIVVQIAIGIVTLVHLFRKPKKEIPNET
jgi:NADH:ubiquinone oxidoreductase subunit K